MKKQKEIINLINKAFLQRSKYKNLLLEHVITETDFLWRTRETYFDTLIKIKCLLEEERKIEINGNLIQERKE